MRAEPTRWDSMDLRAIWSLLWRRRRERASGLFSPPQRRPYAKYPFRFRLHIGYTLDENEVSVHWKVDNTDEKPMYFSIGAHPAFLCPINGEQDKTGYRLRFGNLTDRLHHHGNTPDGMAVMTDEELELEDGEAVITPGFFDKCTYMVEGAQTGEVSILDRDGEAYVTVRFDTPLFALWSPEGKEAPFLCIEPWYGDATRLTLREAWRSARMRMRLQPEAVLTQSTQSCLHSRTRTGI